MKSVRRPSKREIGRIAERQPELLNLLVAYFVFEWQAVRVGVPSHGLDQLRQARMIPDYVDMWSLNRVVHYLLRCPPTREARGSGFISDWLSKVID